MKCIELQPQHSSFVCQTNTAASKKDAPKKGPSAPQRVGPQKMQVRVACCKHFDWKDWQPHAFSPSAFKIFADSAEISAYGLRQAGWPRYAQLIAVRWACTSCPCVASGTACTQQRRTPTRDALKALAAFCCVYCALHPLAAPPAAALVSTAAFAL